MKSLQEGYVPYDEPEAKYKTSSPGLGCGPGLSVMSALTPQSRHNEKQSPDVPEFSAAFLWL